MDQGRRRDHGVADRGAEDARRALDGPDARCQPAAEAIKDRRFADEAWTKDPATRPWPRPTWRRPTLRKALDASPIDERSKAQWGFALRQVMDALSPANTLATNPEALQLAMETGGASLLEGMKLFTEDLAKGRISMTDEDGVRGRPQRRHDAGHRRVPERADPAHPVHADDRQGPRATAGDRPAVHQQVLHPRSATRELLRRARGGRGPHGVPGVLAQRGPAQGTLTWDDYIEQGVIQAIEVAQAITKADKVNTLGFCVGGTLLASALAVLAARTSSRPPA